MSELRRASPAPLDLDGVLGTPVDARTKGFPAVGAPVSISEVPIMGWGLFGDLQPPVLVLRESALAHNLALMSTFCRERGVELAPHGKTTMAPQLWERQLTAGAWGITAATVAQARVMRAVGVRRVVLANELVDGGSIAWACEQLTDPGFHLLCFVDSSRSVSLLEEGLRARRARRRLRVLVELGHAAGRTGCRGREEALKVAGLVRSSPHLELAGAAGYEGTICAERSPRCLAAVASFVRELRDLTLALIDGGAFDGAPEIVVSAGGSSFFDVVVDGLADPWPAGANVRVVLRSGCYLTHDSGVYERLSPLSEATGGLDRFRPAIEVWGPVLSRPEPELAILGFGKRDVSFDLGFPVPRELRTGAGERVAVAGGMRVTALNDQHALCRVEPGFRAEVGDLVGCGVSHPCTALDRWRVIPVLDEDDTVVGAVATFF